MRFAQPQPGSAIGDSVWAPPDAVPGAEAVYKLTADDNESPQYAAFYFLPDITPILNDASLYEADLRKSSDSLITLAWVIASFINGRLPKMDTPHQGSQIPELSLQRGTVIVANGSSPRPEWVEDYHAWYDQEHGGKLGKVPGWQSMRRYELAKVYGEIPTASFYGINFYDEKNGLGGPEWKEGVTPWTLRIRDQAAKPNVRRVWKMVSA